LVDVPVLGVELEPVELEPDELGDELLLASDELGELELLPVLEPLELGEVELEPDLPAPMEPVLPALPEAPDEAAPDEEPPASEPPPLPQADNESAAAAMMASAVPRVNLDAFMEELLGWDCVWRERENGSPSCLEPL
jgi:hypothetical protein